MGIVYQNDLISDLSNVSFVQANGVNSTGDLYPQGVEDRIEMGNWGGVIGDALKVTLYENDALSSGGKRSELGFGYYENGIYLYKFKILIPSIDGITVENDILFTQMLKHFYDSFDADRPCLAIHLRDTVAEFFLRDIWTLASWRAKKGLNYGELKKDEWNDVAVRIKIDTTSNGFLELIINNEIIWREYGLQTVHGEPGQWYPKIGLYNFNQRVGWVKATAYYKDFIVYDNDTKIIDALGGAPSVVNDIMCSDS